MEKIDSKTEAALAEADDLIDQWRKKIHGLYMDADFNGQQNVIDRLWKNVVDNQQLTYERILRRLEKTRTFTSNSPAPSPPAYQDVVPSNNSDQSVGNGRMAASFPGFQPMQSVPGTQPVQSVPAQLMPPVFAVAQNVPAVVNGVGKNHRQQSVPSNAEKSFPFQVKSAGEKIGLPMDWRSAVKAPAATTGVVSVNPPPHGPPARSDSFPALPSRVPHDHLANLALSDDLASNASNDGSEEGIPQPRKVFLTNLARESESKTIAEHFKPFGTVVDVKIFRFPSGESRGFGSVEFKEEASAKSAIAGGKQVIDGREVDVKSFMLREGVPSLRGVKRFQIFLGGVPSFLSKDEVLQALGRQVQVRELKLNSERGYGYLDLEKESDVLKLLKAGYVKIGEKMVECKENYRQ